MTSILLREIQKLEVRFRDYLTAEQKFSEHAKDCIKIFNDLVKGLDKTGKTYNSKRIKKLSTLRRGAIKSLGEMLKSEVMLNMRKAISSSLTEH
jgi:hypothetical protein